VEEDRERMVGGVVKWLIVCVVVWHRKLLIELWSAIFG